MLGSGDGHYYGLLCRPKCLLDSTVWGFTLKYVHLKYLTFCVGFCFFKWREGRKKIERKRRKQKGRERDEGRREGREEGTRKKRENEYDHTSFFFVKDWA